MVFAAVCVAVLVGSPKANNARHFEFDSSESDEALQVFSVPCHCILQSVEAIFFVVRVFFGIASLQLLTTGQFFQV